MANLYVADKLTSEPAMKFYSDSFEDDIVYSSMVNSAFQDLKKEFKRLFLSVQ